MASLFFKDKAESGDVTLTKDNKQKNKKMKGNNFFKNKKKLLIFSGIFIAIIVFITLLVYLNFIRIQKYVKYEEKMNTYGFDKLYTNSTAKTGELVTKSEAIKVIIGSILNTYNISDYAMENTEFANAMWVDYAETNKIVNEDININNEKDNIKYIDVLRYLGNAKNILFKNIGKVESDANISDINKYSLEEQIIIKDMIGSKIIQEEINSINGEEYVFKGKLNELLINFVEKNNIVTYNNEKLNINPDKNPLNAADYPYILSTVEKSIYEIPFLQKDETAQSPKVVYNAKKNRYSQIETFSKQFFDTILNIDYRTITVEKLEASFNDCVAFNPKRESLELYVKYVKENEIILSGEAKLQMPIIYYDGSYYRARYILNFKIENSKTKNNIIYLDWEGVYDTTYEKTEYKDIIIDYFLKEGYGGGNMYIYISDFYNSIRNIKNIGITQFVPTYEEEVVSDEIKE